MRLINTRTLQLEEFDASHTPKYVILSHTWGAKEVVYQDLVGRQDRPRGPREWNKVHASCALAASEGYEYIWIDSCCIDKLSSAELSEAINSMFRWYAMADRCIAYLEDVDNAAVGWQWNPETVFNPPGELLDKLRGSRWFQRGWTLQELVAPKQVDFYGTNWLLFGNRNTLSAEISAITAIPCDILEGELFEEHDESSIHDHLETIAVARRMSWAARRETTRPEDLAYCLMGIFNINMPLMYGEGGTRAFRRLQQEIVRSTVDESVYCWNIAHSSSNRKYYGLLAEHPSAFDHEHCRNLARPKYISRRERNIATITGDGLRLSLLRTPDPIASTADIHLVVLACDIVHLPFRNSTNDLVDLGESKSPVLILQRTTSVEDSEFVRIRPDLIVSAYRDQIQVSGGLVIPPGLTGRLQEPCLHQIFVPHGKPYTWKTRGYLFAQPEPLQNSNSGNRLGRFSPCLGSWVSTDRWDELGIHLEDNRKLLEEAWERTVFLGALKPDVDLGSLPTIPDPCLVFGVSPLPDSGFGVRPFYREYWIAWEEYSKIQEQNYSGLMSSQLRACRNLLARPLMFRTELVSLYARLHHRVHVGIEEEPNVLNEA